MTRSEHNLREKLTRGVGEMGHSDGHLNRLNHDRGPRSAIENKW